MYIYFKIKLKRPPAKKVYYQKNIKPKEKSTFKVIECLHSTLKHFLHIYFP